MIIENHIFTRGYATRENISFYDHSWKKFLSYTNIQQISSIYHKKYNVSVNSLRIQPDGCLEVCKGKHPVAANHRAAPVGNLGTCIRNSCSTRPGVLDTQFQAKNSPVILDMCFAFGKRVKIESKILYKGFFDSRFVKRDKHQFCIN